MAKLKKNGEPKLSGGKRTLSGRPVKNASPRKYVNLYLDKDLYEEFIKLSADEKNEVVRNGLSLRS